MKDSQQVILSAIDTIIQMLKHSGIKPEKITLTSSLRAMIIKELGVREDPTWYKSESRNETLFGLKIIIDDETPGIMIN